MKTCFFIGHRDIGEFIFPRLEAEIEHHIVEYGVEEFFVGRYGHFDCMAAQAVQNVKECHPEIRLTLVLPYLTREPLPSGFDGSIYPDGLENVPRRYTIPRANRAIVARCDYLIASVYRPFGNAYEIAKFAARKGIIVSNLM